VSVTPVTAPGYALLQVASNCRARRRASATAASPGSMSSPMSKISQ
jgi:hypothetical protein